MNDRRPASKQEWERAERERSRREAETRTPASLRLGKKFFARYSAPPVDSPYPLEHSFALLGDIRNLNVLDYGCGDGANALLLAKRGARVVGLDISDSLIRLAGQRFEVNGLPRSSARFVVGSAHESPFDSGSFDLVFGMAILHHIDLDAASREVFRLLKDGGRAIFAEPVGDSRTLRIARRIFPNRSPEISPFERPLTSSEFERFASPFTIDSKRVFALPFVALTRGLTGRLSRSPRYVHTRSSRWVDRVYRLDRALLERFPFLRRYSAVTVISLSKPWSS